MTLHPLPRRLRTDPAYDAGHPALLPACDEVRRATIRAYQLGGITDAAARQQLEMHCGMSAVDAARAIANAIEVKG